MLRSLIFLIGLLLLMKNSYAMTKDRANNIRACEPDLMADESSILLSMLKLDPEIFSEQGEDGSWHPQLLPTLSAIRTMVSHAQALTSIQVEIVLNEILEPISQRLLQQKRLQDKNIANEIDAIVLEISKNQNLSLPDGRLVLTFLASTQRSFASAFNCLTSILQKFQQQLEYRDLDQSAAIVFSQLFISQGKGDELGGTEGASEILIWILQHPESPLSAIEHALKVLDLPDSSKAKLSKLMEVLIRQIDMCPKNTRQANPFLKQALQAVLRKRAYFPEVRFYGLLSKILESPHIHQADGSDILHAIEGTNPQDQSTVFALAGVFRKLCHFIINPNQLRMAHSEYRRILTFFTQ